MHQHKEYGFIILLHKVNVLLAVDTHIYGLKHRPITATSCKKYEVLMVIVLALSGPKASVSDIDGCSAVFPLTNLNTALVPQRYRCTIRFV